MLLDDSCGISLELKVITSLSVHKAVQTKTALNKPIPTGNTKKHPEKRWKMSLTSVVLIWAIYNLTLGRTVMLT